MRHSYPSALLPAAVVLVAASSASAQGAVPPPSWARSVETVDEGVVVYDAPDEGADRRGTVALGTRLPVLRRVPAARCETGYGVQVGPAAFVCQHYVAFSREAPGGTAQPPTPEPGQLLPHTYAFVGFDGTRAYSHPSDYDADQYAEAYGEGFGVILVERARYRGLTFFKTRRGHWIERSNLRFARPSDFVGVRLEEGDPLDVAWVLREGARVFERPRGRVVRRASHRAVVHVAEEVGRHFIRLTDGTFMLDRDLARARPQPRPEGVAEDERWLAVDVTEQVVVAYEGDRAVYATLASTGRPTRSHRTPLGTHRVWVKLATSDMDDLERTDVERNYSIEAVPWVLYFEGSNGFHAAFWHDDFGRPRSHGCVNLAPRDARFIFDFAGPALPPGWTAILPTDDAPGTPVHVFE